MEFSALLPNAEDLEYLASVYLCVRCSEIHQRDEHSYPTELSGPEINTLVYIPYHSAYDALHKEFWHDLSGGWWLPICETCAADWSMGDNHHGDPRIGFISEFVSKVCNNFPFESEKTS